MYYSAESHHTHEHKHTYIVHLYNLQTAVYTHIGYAHTCIPCVGVRVKLIEVAMAHGAEYTSWERHLLRYLWYAYVHHNC